MNKLKPVFPKSALILLHYYLILPHINYCILAWRKNAKRVFELQKRAVRIITRNHFVDHTDPIFLHLQLLKVNDLFNFFQLEFYFKVNKYKLTNRLAYFHNTFIFLI